MMEPGHVPTSLRFNELHSVPVRLHACVRSWQSSRLQQQSRAAASSGTEYITLRAQHAENATLVHLRSLSSRRNVGCDVALISMIVYSLPGYHRCLGESGNRAWILCCGGVLPLLTDEGTIINLLLKVMRAEKVVMSCFNFESVKNPLVPSLSKQYGNLRQGFAFETGAFCCISGL